MIILNNQLQGNYGTDGNDNNLTLLMPVTVEFGDAHIPAYVFMYQRLSDGSMAVMCRFEQTVIYNGQTLHGVIKPVNAYQYNEFEGWVVELSGADFETLSVL